MDFNESLSRANRFLDSATFPRATKRQVAELTAIFEKRAERTLSPLELTALFSLQHSLTNKKLLIEDILSGKVAVVRQRGNGLFEFAAR
jgi:hypothetical protein